MQFLQNQFYRFQMQRTQTSREKVQNYLMSLDTDSLEDFEQVEKVFDKLTLEGSPATSASSGCQNGPITRSKTAKGKVLSLMNHNL